MPIDIQQVVQHTHASENTKIHALYNYYYHHKTVAEIAEIYVKTPETIRNWIQRYKKTGTVARVYFFRHPLSFLDEAQAAVKERWKKGISVLHIWGILNVFGIRWKAAERRAMHIKEADVMGFTFEVNSLDWTLYNLVFLDEVSFDNCSMVQKRRYALKGKKLHSFLKTTQLREHLIATSFENAVASLPWNLAM
ncbi:hypothetical protein HDU78_010103 [Chytriomyces hyalinus]|nr:hypothetical protein HDU78_010103 [Chytriomyces hyalinus]